MQIITTSSGFTRSQITQIASPQTDIAKGNISSLGSSLNSSLSKLDNRDELFRRVNTDEYRTGKTNIGERGVDRSAAASANRQLITSNNGYLPVGNQQQSAARMVDPVNPLPVFSRNAVAAYETMSRLEENNQLTQVLGFDAFA